MPFSGRVCEARVSEIWKWAGLLRAHLTCPWGHQVPPSVGSQWRLCFELCWVHLVGWPGEERAVAVLSCQPGARTGRESYVNSKSSTSCCICPGRPWVRE